MRISDWSSDVCSSDLPNRGRWFWAYHIRIENGGTEAVQLLTRSWTITDSRGAQHRVEGEGVVGEQPMIEPGSAYDYVSRSEEHQSELQSLMRISYPVFCLKKETDGPRHTRTTNDKRS